MPSVHVAALTAAFAVTGASSTASVGFPWQNAALPPEQRADLLVSNMTLTEKIHMLHGSGVGYVGNVKGIQRLGVPALRLNDGPQGFRAVDYSGTSTQFPSGLTVAATWDVDMATLWGQAMGKEFFDKGANVQLGPGVCVARVPHNGRNFEYVSGEDPCLGATMVGPVISGIQSTGGVIANVKHFVDNSQETDRMRISEEVGERPQFELYYPPFEAAIKAEVGSLMCSYNKINGTYSCENPNTLRRDLKERLGFDGWVMSDWGATHSASIEAGLDQEMPAGVFMGDVLELEVVARRINQSYVDDSVKRITTQMFKFGLFDIENNNTRSNNVTSQEHCDVSREIASAAMVLLQNKDDVLPLSVTGKTTIALIGDQATKPIVGGLGSGAVAPAHVVSPAWSFRNLLGLPQPPELDASEAPQPECNADGTCIVVVGSKNTTLASEVAAGADTTVVFLGTTSTEGVDRTTLGFGDDDALVSAVAAASKRTAVVAVAPGAFLTPWRDDVESIIAAFMPGQEYGNAVVDVLTGKVNPSGSLPLTLPAVDNQVNLTKQQWPGVDMVSTYTEGLLIGYRWYDAHSATPAFPFGHGLSYTTFQFSNVTASSTSPSFTLTNNGTVKGAAVPQLVC